MMLDQFIIKDEIRQCNMEHTMALVEQKDTNVWEADAMHNALLSTLHDCMSVSEGRYIIYGVLLGLYLRYFAEEELISFL